LTGKIIYIVIGWLENVYTAQISAADCCVICLQTLGDNRGGNKPNVHNVT